MPKTKDDVIQAIKDHIDLVDYVQSCGYTITRVGSYYSTREVDSLRITPDRKYYFRNSDSSNRGDIINFVEHFEGKNTAEAISHLRGLLPSYASGYAPHLNYHNKTYNKQKAVQRLPFVLPDKHPGQYRRLFAYLNKTRGIHKDIINDMVRKRYIYESKDKHNIVFVGRHQKSKEIVFAEQKGTTDYPFRGTVTGSDRSVAFFVPGNKNSKALFITEACIDAMSLMTFCKMNNLNYKEYSFLSLCGNNPQAVKFHLSQPQNQNIEKVYLAFDNDKGGEEHIKSAAEQLKEIGFRGEVILKMPTHNDWNDDLKVHLKIEPRVQPQKQIQTTIEKSIIKEEIRSIAR